MPSVPGELSAEVTGTSVSLSWSAVDDATDYVVEVGWTPATSETVLTNSAEPRHWIASIALGTHFARVHAHNWCGTSESSEAVAFSVQSSDQ